MRLWDKEEVPSLECWFSIYFCFILTKPDQLSDRLLHWIYNGWPVSETAKFSALLLAIRLAKTDMKISLKHCDKQ